MIDAASRSLVDRAPCGILATTEDGTIVDVNATFLAQTGYTRDDLVGRRRFAELLTPGGRIYHETHYAPMLQMQGAARELALDIVRTDGTRLPALVNSVVYDDGVVRLMVTAIFEATERREYERELLRAKRRAEESEAAAQVLARTLQATLMPPALPAIPGLDVAAVYRPAGTGAEVGGDFYDVFQVGEDEWYVAIGDVQGKGVEAAVVTALARYTVRGAAVQEPSPSIVLHATNLTLLHDDTDRYCTIALLRLHRTATGWVATIALAGHPRPLLRRAGVSVCEFGVYGVPAGIFEEAHYVDATVTLDPLDCIVLYTDGVTEARVPGGGFFGEAGLRSAVARHTGDAATTATGVVAEVAGGQGGSTDDIAVVAVAVLN